MVTPSPTIDRPSDYVYFNDDFDDTTSGWPTLSASTVITNYESGFYRIWVNVDEIKDVTAINGELEYPDARIEVSTTNYGIMDNALGIICRYKNETNYYFFVISNDGYFGIGKKVNNNDIPDYLYGDSMVPVADVPDGYINTDLNRLKAICDGNTLAFYVNDTLLASVTDDSLTSGWVGLIASSMSIPEVDIHEVDVHFDDLVVAKP
jgi:hypothetical protein